MGVTRKIGLGLMIVGVAIWFLNILDPWSWKINLDLVDAIIFTVGLIITVFKWEKLKPTQKSKKRKL